MICWHTTGPPLGPEMICVQPVEGYELKLPQMERSSKLGSRNRKHLQRDRETVLKAGGPEGIAVAGSKERAGMWGREWS